MHGSDNSRLSSSSSQDWKPEVRKLVNGASAAPLPQWVDSFVTRCYYSGGCSMKHAHAANHNTSAFCVRCCISFCRNPDSMAEHKPHGIVLVQRLSGEHVVAATDLAALCNIQGIRRTYRSGQEVVLVYPDTRWPKALKGELTDASRCLIPSPIAGRCICNGELNEVLDISRGFVYCTLLCKSEAMKRAAYLRRAMLPELLAGLRYCAFQGSPIVPWLDQVPWGRLHLGDEETPEYKRWMGSLLRVVEAGIDPNVPPSTRVFCTGCDRMGCKSSKPGHNKLQLRKLGLQYGISISLCEAVMNIDGIQRLAIQKEECVLVVGVENESYVFPSSACICGARLRNVDQGVVFCSIACKKACLDDPAIRRRAMLPDLYQLLLDECLSGDLKASSSGLPGGGELAAATRGLDFDLNMEPSRLGFLELPDQLTSALAVQECMDESTREKIAASDRESAKRKRAATAAAPEKRQHAQDPEGKPWYQRQVEYTLAMYAKEDAEKVLQESQMKVSTPPRSESAAAAAPTASMNTTTNLSLNGEASASGSGASSSGELTIVAERMVRVELEREKRASTTTSNFSKHIIGPQVLRVTKKRRSMLPVTKRQVSHL